jgi:ribonuclease P protein component
VNEPHECSKTASPRPERLKRRFEFQNAAKGKRFHSAAFTLQSAPSPAPFPPAAVDALGPSAAPRFGLTVTKKIGNAVVRNRIRRRLKDALRGLDPLPGRPGHDYVIVAKSEALGMKFLTLQGELLRALGLVDSSKPGKRRHDRRPSAGA